MYLSYISDENLFTATKKVLGKLSSAIKRPESQLFKNAIDPFSGLFDSLIQDIELDEWLKQEKSRQIQKTFQNAVGNFHQEIIGSMYGWENLKTGSIVDVRNKEKKIIAEIKNKHNTIKGDQKPRVYDDLEIALSRDEHKDFTGYLVEIIPKRKQKYDKPFVPSDNTTSIKRPENQKLRIISGQLFYEIASGEKDALRKLYMALPGVISEITGKPLRKIIGNTSPELLFEKTF